MNGRNQQRICSIARNVLALLLNIALLVGANKGLEAATFYLAPGGSDSNNGTSLNSAWRTFSHAIPRLGPGDTLVLRDGIYNGSTSGYPNIVCGTNAKSGTSSQPITIRAENERRAWLKGSGENSDRFRLINCSWWVIEGLRISDADAPISVLRFGFYCDNCTNVTLRRTLHHNNNRYGNTHLVLWWAGGNNLMEEAEIYNFHRHGIVLSHSTGNVLRRIYCNSRNHKDLPDGRFSGNTATGDDCVAIYPASNNIVENLFCEGTDTCAASVASGPTVNNRHFGVIAWWSSAWPVAYGLYPKAMGATTNTMPRDITCENCVFVTAVRGFAQNGARGSRCDNCTFAGSQIGVDIRAAGGPTGQGDGNFSFFSTNSLFADLGTAARRLDSDCPSCTWTWEHHTSNRFNSGNFSPNTNIINQTSLNHNLGACPVFVRDASSLKGAGIGGADIGANVLYAYENGALTTKPLWDPNTKQIRPELRGATVKDASLDTTSNSIHDFGSRLHPNCTSWPAGYGLVSATPPAPSGVTVRAQ